MASKKKASEGIALLSMYGDEDDEMEDVEEPDENMQEEEEVKLLTSDAVAENCNDEVQSYYGNRNTPRQQEAQDLNDIFSPNKPFDYVTASTTASPGLLFFSPQPQQQTLVQNRLTIVDYGHEEGAMSPEAEDGEMLLTGRVMYGEQLHISGEIWENRSPVSALLPTLISQATHPQSLEPIDPPESDAINFAINASESVETEDTVMDSEEKQKDISLLDKFLPPPPKAKCSEELQEKIIKFLALKRTTGKSFNAEVRNRKEYRNPDFLLHAVTYQDIDQIGSCFSKDVFNPHGYEKSDFYDEIEADMRREIERKEQERKKNQKVDFVTGGTQSGNLIPTPKINIPVPGMTSTVASSVSNVTPVATDAATRDGRQNKKSKWDKVDDQRNPLPSGSQENMSAVGAHAALLSAAKAGSGYTAFAQQRRKEAENRRSSERKLERRS